MMKKNIIIALASALLTLLLPFLAVTFKGGGEGETMYLVMFFSLYPMAAILIGIISGQDIKACWFQPLLFSALFVLGTWIFLKMGESAFLNYGVRYLILGYAVALLSAWFTHRRRKAAEKEMQKKK